jgi:hypothetical protein
MLNVCFDLAIAAETLRGQKSKLRIKSRALIPL